MAWGVWSWDTMGPGAFSGAGVKRSTPEGLHSLPGNQIELPLMLVCRACPPGLHSAAPAL